MKCSIILLAASLVATTALGDPPPWAKGKGKGHAERESRESADFFNDQQRVVVRDYYDSEFRSGRCPPGLAKKNNGCMPPGQAKKWQVGRPLPPDVVYYEVPQPLVMQLGPPPAGYRYVRVASDILLIAAGSGMVAAALEDLARR